MGGSRRRRAPSGSVGSSCTVFRVTATLSEGHSVPVTMMKVERSTSSSKTRWPGQERDERWEVSVCPRELWSGGVWMGRSGLWAQGSSGLLVTA